MSLGYANNFNDLHKGDENKNRLNTGDIAKKDKDNFYYIVGRKNRYAKVYGNRINLSELEYIIMDYGIQSKCENNYEDKITVYVTKVDDKKKLITVTIKIDNGYLEFKANKKRIYSSTTYIFVLWMISASIILFIVALLFLKNQIKPIRKLAIEVDRFGIFSFSKSINFK